MITKGQLEAFKKTLNQFNKAVIKINKVDFDNIYNANLKYNLLKIEIKETTGEYFINGTPCFFDCLIQLGNFYIKTL
jgi:hypothetical protein